MTCREFLKRLKASQTKTNVQLLFHAGGKFTPVISVLEKWEQSTPFSKVFSLHSCQTVSNSAQKKHYYIASLFLRGVCFITPFMHAALSFPALWTAQGGKNRFKRNTQTPDNSNSCFLEKKPAHCLPYSTLWHRFVACTVIKRAKRTRGREELHHCGGRITAKV